MKLKRAVSGLAGFLLALCLAVFVLACLLDGAGTSADLMADMMRRFAPSGDTGLPEEEYDGMALMITRYLAGAENEFQYTLDDGSGGETGVFQAHEQQHMADCRDLFVLDRKVLLVTATLATGLAAVLLLLRQKRQGAMGCLIGGCFALLCVAAVGVWALIDFEGPFVLFHRISFSNNLWLLDPDTDMLIRLMPLDFFIHYVLYIGVTWLLFLGLWIAGSAVALRKAASHRTKRGMQ